MPMRSRAQWSSRGSPDSPRCCRRFGAGVLAPNGGLDRRALRELIFSDSSKRRDLERILHPLIRAEMERQAQAARGPYLVMAIPLLVESGLRDRVDRVLVVDAGEAAQVARLMARDGGSEEQARAILAAQAAAPRGCRRRTTCWTIAAARRICALRSMRFTSAFSASPPSRRIDAMPFSPRTFQDSRFTVDLPLAQNTAMNSNPDTAAEAAAGTRRIRAAAQ